jgi:hypothetical protein
VTENREDLIRDLVADLRPVRHAGRIGPSLVAWLASAGAYSVFVVLATGPLRPGALGNLLAYPAFGFESLLAVLAIGALAHAALRTAIPGDPRRLLSVVIALALTSVWVSVYVIGIWHPAHPVSDLGARNHCIWQTVLFSVPSCALMFWLARRLVPLSPRLTGALAGAAAAGIPGALMQFGCMYDPAHILVAHMSPMPILAAAGLLIGPLAVAARRAVPRSRGVSIH